IDDHIIILWGVTIPEQQGYARYVISISQQIEFIINIIKLCPPCFQCCIHRRKLPSPHPLLPPILTFPQQHQALCFSGNKRIIALIVFYFLLQPLRLNNLSGSKKRSKNKKENNS